MGGPFPFLYSKGDAFHSIIQRRAHSLSLFEWGLFHYLIRRRIPSIALFQKDLFFFFIWIRGPFHSFIQKEIPSISYSKKASFHSFIQRRSPSLSLLDWGFPSIPSFTGFLEPEIWPQKNLEVFKNKKNKKIKKIKKIKKNKSLARCFCLCHLKTLTKLFEIGHILVAWGRFSKHF